MTAHLELRKALADQSLHDRLTGLPNRQLLCAKADELLDVRRGGADLSISVNLAPASSCCATSCRSSSPR